MSDTDKLKDQLLQALLHLANQSRDGHVGLNVTGEYNRVLVVA